MCSKACMAVAIAEFFLLRRHGRQVEVLKHAVVENSVGSTRIQITPSQSKMTPARPLVKRRLMTRPSQATGVPHPAVARPWGGFCPWRAMPERGRRAGRPVPRGPVPEACSGLAGAKSSVSSKSSAARPSARMGMSGGKKIHGIGHDQPPGRHEAEIQRNGRAQNARSQSRRKRPARRRLHPLRRASA